MTVTIQSYNQFLGNMVRKLLAETDINDINTAAVALTLLEAAAGNDFDNNVALLNVLDLLSLDALTDSELDARAADYGLVRRSAIQAAGFVEISNSNITKQSTSLYPLKNAPLAGQQVLYVNNAEGWSTTGSGNLYVGRGTSNYEGPIEYDSITDNTTFYTIHLTARLQNNHLISETVINAQNTTDQMLNAGLVVRIPANNQQPAADYQLVRGVILAAGEDTLTNIPVVASLAGSAGSAGIGTITSFSGSPFPGATVVNTSPITNGTDAESDDNLRERIKNYTNTLARGTSAAILAAILGISDDIQGDQVVSASIVEPTTSGEPAIIYIDDGTGFEPTYAGQAIDILINGALGGEEFLQLANYPVTRPQVVSAASGPYDLLDGMTLVVRVDGVDQHISFAADQFNNITTASIAEVVNAGNPVPSVTFTPVFNIFGADSGSRLRISTTAFDAETLQVMPYTANPLLDANNIFQFPTEEVSFIRVYQNGILLHEKETHASLVTLPFNDWLSTIWPIGYSATLTLAIDNTDYQVKNFATVDFGMELSAAGLSDWVAVFNKKFAGVTATVTSDNSLQITSNKSGSSSAIEVIGGTLLRTWFSQLPTSSTGQTSEFTLNRENGNIKILNTINQYDIIEAGSNDTRGSIISTQASSAIGTFNLLRDTSGLDAVCVFVVDGTNIVKRTVPYASSTLQVDIVSGVMRLTSVPASAGTFINIQPSDYVYIVDYHDDQTSPDGWLQSANCGLFKVLRKDNTLGNWIDLANYNASGLQASVTIQDLTYTSVAYRASANSLQIVYIADGTAGSEVVNVGGSVITIHIGSISQYSTAAQVMAAFNASLAATALATVALSGSSTNYQVAGGPANFSGGSDSEGPFALRTGNDIQAFSSDVMPQLWNATTSVGSVAATLTQIAASLNIDLSNITANVYKTITVKVTSTTEHSGNIMIPISTGNAQILFAPTAVEVTGYPPHVAAISPTKDFITTFEATNLQYTFLDRHSYTDQRDTLNTTMEPNVGILNLTPLSAVTNGIRYDDVASITSGNNRDGYRYILNAVTVPAIPTSATPETSAILTTQLSGIDLVKPFLFMESLIADQVQLVKALELSDTDTFITVIDQDPVNKTFDTPMWRTGQVTTTAHSVTALSFDADDIDSEAGANFSNLAYWPTIANGGITDFNNYKIWFKARNWYVSTGTGAGLMIRSNKFGPTGQNISFALEYPSAAEQLGSVAQVDSPTGSLITYYFGSDAAKFIGLSSGDHIYITDQGSHVIRYWLPLTASISSLVVGDIFSIPSSLGWTGNTTGIYRLTAVNSISNYVEVYNAASSTAPNTVTTATYTVTLPTTATGSTVQGLYFTVNDGTSPVAFWFQVASNPGSQPSGIPVGTRAVRVTVASLLDTVNTIATDIYNAAHASLSGFETNTTAPGANIINIITNASGVRAQGDPTGMWGLSGFNLSTIVGFTGVPYTLSNVLPTFFSLTDNLGSKVISVVNAAIPSLINLGAIGSDATFNFATRDDISLASYGGTPGTSTSVQLFDGENFILKFQNGPGPNFALKSSMQLPLYDGITQPYYNISTANELFKLIPVTLENLQHQLIHPAISQLSIVSKVDIAENNRQIQITSTQVGSAGAVEVMAGRANQAQFNLFSASQPLTTGAIYEQYLQTIISAFPDTLNSGDHVLLTNSVGVARRTFLHYSDQVDVLIPLAGTASTQYVLHPRVTGTSASFWILQTPGTNPYWWRLYVTGMSLANVVAGDQLVLTNFASVLTTPNQSPTPATNSFLGFPIVGVNISSGYVDYINPFGLAAGSSGSPITVNNHGPGGGAAFLAIMPSLSLSWPLAHKDISTTPTYYKLEKLGFNNMMRLSYVSGSAPWFLRCGAAVDDMVTLSGQTFDSNNNGIFRILAVDETTIIFQNSTGTDQIDRVVPLNNIGSFSSNGAVDWPDFGTTSETKVTGPSGSFGNITAGSSIKKVDDPDTYYRLVTSIQTNVPVTGTDTANLSQPYPGTAANVAGVGYNQQTGVGLGVPLQYIYDVCISEGDATLIGDSWFVNSSQRTGWFAAANSGTFAITAMGNTTANTNKYWPYVQVNNSSAVTQLSVPLYNDFSEIFPIEQEAYKYTTTRQVVYTTLNQADTTQRIVYLTPGSRSYKLSESNGTIMSALGKIGYSNNVTIGIDGYSYYTGLLRTVQRTIDGFEPDPETYPGMRAVGTIIELLPPLTYEVSMSIKVTPNKGTNLSDLTTEIQSAIITYVNQLPVGQNIILSEIIAIIMNINGVANATFTRPTPDNVSIGTINPNQKPYITINDIEIT